MKLPFSHKEDFPFEISGKPDRLSQTLFGKFSEKIRWKALDAISVPKQSIWDQRLLLWMLANDNSEMRDRAWEVLKQIPLDVDLLLSEISCPMWQVRMGVCHLLANTGRLDVVRHMVAGLEDYNKNVVEETKRSLSELIERAKERQRTGELSSKEIEEALHTFYQPLFKSKRSAGFQAIQFLFQTAPLDEDLFWVMYIGLDTPQFSLLHEEFIHYQTDGSLEVLYRGLLQNDEQILQRLTAFIAVAIRNSGVNVNHHLRAIRTLKRDDFVKIAYILQDYRILVEFQGLIKFMDPPERIILFDLLEAVGAEQNLAFLLRCLQLDDSRIRIRVLKILGESETLGLRNEVFEYLTDTDEQVLLATLRYLQKKGDLSILEKISHLTRSKKTKVRQGVVTTMFKIMKDILLRDFDKFSSTRRMKILTWLKRLKPNFFSEISHLSESTEETDRIRYIKLLEAEELNKALTGYHRLSGDPNPKVRATAITGFKRIKDEEMRIKFIRPFFEDEDPRVRANVIDMLTENRPQQQSIIELVKRSARSKHRRERANSYAKLINWGYKEFENELTKMLEVDDEMTKASALWVLGVTNLPHLLNHLREAANDPRSRVREMAVRGIGLKGAEEDLRALMPFLQDPDRNVRIATQKALRNRLHLSFEIA